MFGLSNEIIANILGAIGLVLFFISFQFKDRKHLIILQTVSLVIFTTQYFILGAIAGVVTESICIVRNIVFYFKKKKSVLIDSLYSISFILINIIISIVLFIYKIDTFNYLFFIVITAFSLQTVGLLVENNKINRHLFLIVSPLWIIYNLINHAYFAAITDSLNIVSIVISLIRIYRHHE